MAEESRVYIVEDDNELRETLTAMVESVGLDVKSYDSGKPFLDDYDPGHPGCVVLDVRLPELSGTEVQRKLRDQGSSIPVIIITGYADVPVAVEAMKRGAVDFLVKPFSNQVLLSLVQKCVDLDAKQREDDAARRVYVERYENLTTRERDVLQLMLRGRSNKEIATGLGISIKTVEAHRSNVMQKMEAPSFAELVESATLYGMAEVEETPAPQ